MTEKQQDNLLEQAKKEMYKMAYPGPSKEENIKLISEAKEQVENEFNKFKEKNLPIKVMGAKDLDKELDKEVSRLDKNLELYEKTKGPKTPIYKEDYSLDNKFYQRNTDKLKMSINDKNPELKSAKEKINDSVSKYRYNHKEILLSRINMTNNALEKFNKSDKNDLAKDEFRKNIAQIDRATAEAINKNINTFKKEMETNKLDYNIAFDAAKKSKENVFVDDKKVGGLISKDLINSAKDNYKFNKIYDYIKYENSNMNKVIENIKNEAVSQKYYENKRESRNMTGKGEKHNMPKINVEDKIQQASKQSQIQQPNNIAPSNRGEIGLSDR